LPKAVAGFVFLTINRKKTMNNNNKTKVTARFAPETRFTLPTATNAPFRANLETEFERLKNRLLAETLDEAERPELNTPLRRAANEAAALAWVTFYPLLVFPTLFEEKTRVAVRQADRQSRVYANSRELPSRFVWSRWRIRPSIC